MRSRNRATSVGARPRPRKACATRPSRSATSVVTLATVTCGRKRSGSWKTARSSFEVVRLAQFVQRDFVSAVDRRSEIRADDEALHVADDQQRRVFERILVEQELLVSLFQILPLALVLPAEEAPLPHVGPPAPAAVLGRAALESEPLARGVGLRRLRVLEQFAEVEEMLLRSRTLRQF